MSQKNESNNTSNQQQPEQFHPIEILVDAVLYAQRRGAFLLEEAELVAKAVRLTRDNVENLRSPFALLHKSLQNNGLMPSNSSTQTESTQTTQETQKEEKVSQSPESVPESSSFENVENEVNNMVDNVVSNLKETVSKFKELSERVEETSKKIDDQSDKPKYTEQKSRFVKIDPKDVDSDKSDDFHYLRQNSYTSSGISSLSDSITSDESD
jgi:hypothetical protein